MKYIIMLLVVIGLAAADFLTGIIKAYCRNSICSKKMRRGGLNKLSEIIVMTSVCGLDTGIKALGQYYHAAELSSFAGAITAAAVFFYITAMETVSILENYAAVNPDAEWALKIAEKLKGNDREE